MQTFRFLVTLVTLYGAGALQLLPGTLGVCYPTRRPFTRSGVLAGVGVGLVVLYLTLVTFPHALGIHGAIWSTVANFATCIGVSAFTKAGVLAGVGVGLAVLYLTLVTFPNALGIHGAIWSIVANFATCIAVSAFTQPPSAETIGRIHGAIEDYVYGSGEAGLTRDPLPSTPHSADSV